MVLHIVWQVFIVENNKMRKLIFSKHSAIALVVILLIVPLAIIGKQLVKTDSEQDSNLNNINSQLLINTDKVQYSVGDKVNIQITSLSNDGVVLCDSEMKLLIIKEGETIEQPKVTLSPTCDPKATLELNPDYTASFTPSTEGEYLLNVTDSSVNTTSQVAINVGGNIEDFSITRWGANKVSPQSTNRYPMKITLYSNKNFTGKLIDRLPANLKVVWYGPAKVEKSEESQFVTWEVELKKGESKEYTYEYTIPSDVDNNLRLGNLKLVSKEKVYFEETRPWIIAVNHE